MLIEELCHRRLRAELAGGICEVDLDRHLDPSSEEVRTEVVGRSLLLLLLGAEGSRECRLRWEVVGMLLVLIES